MKTMSAIYQKVRHRLTDDWAYGNDMDARPWDFQARDVCRCGVRMFYCTLDLYTLISFLYFESGFPYESIFRYPGGRMRVEEQRGPVQHSSVRQSAGRS